MRRFLDSHFLPQASVLVALFLSFSEAFPQCEVTANSTYTEITCGECVTLSHFGSTQGNVSFSEDFNNGQPTGWAFTQQASFNNPCSANGVDGTTHIWMGDQSGVPRTLETLPLDFGPAVAPAGGTICFDMLFAAQGDNSPCEGPDEPDEGVFLQYSTDGGNNWTTIEYFDPNGGNDQQLVNWNNWCFDIPQAALTNNVQFRWFQDADSGAEYDHWGIDNVEIIVNDPTVEYVWQHDNYTTPLPGENPTEVCPLTTTTYTVNMTSATGNCTDDIEVVVVDPVVEVNAGDDQSICPDDCIDLNGTAQVVNDPGGITTFENNQTESFDASVFGGAAVNVNVQDLNMTNVNPNSLVEVCLTNLEFTGFGLPPGGVEALSVTLICPDGTEVELAPINTAPAGGFASPSYYESACFVSTGGTDLANADPDPITGTFNSGEPLNGMDGCTANGVWSIEVSTNAFTGNGTFDGWSITFDDEPDEYEPDVLWSPTTDMASGEETTLTPEVCPTGAITYTLTASDDAGCVTVSDDVAITIDQNCCDPQTPPIQGPTPLCENATGNVYSVTNTPGSTYTWTVPAGATIVSGQGSNSITVDFGTTGGTVSVVETIQCGDGPAQTFDVVVEPCAGCTMDNLDVQMTDCYISGQGQLQYDVEATVTFTNPPATGQLVISDCFLNTQTFDPPFTSPLTVTFTGLPQDGLDCDFGAVFTDDQNCATTTTFTAPPTISAVTAECVSGSGVVDGTIEFNNPSGTGNIVIEINDGTGTQSTTIQPPYSSPETWQVTGLDPAVPNYTVTYYFDNYAMCQQTGNLICGCSADAGTVTATVNDIPVNNVTLCENDTLVIQTNGDFTYPEDEGALGPNGEFPYAPALTFLIYTCPPTQGVFPPDDPCFAGVFPFDGGMADVNEVGNSILDQFPPGTFTDNEIYYMPITLYHFDPATPNYIININCWNTGPVTSVTYLPPIDTTVVEDCSTNSVSVNISGGDAELNGTEFTASGLSPATANLATPSAGNNGTIVVDGLQNGDNYSFEITDATGCGVIVNGGPFEASPDADAGADTETCQLSYQLQGTLTSGTGTWTGGPAGTTFSPDANTPDATVTVPASGSYTFTWAVDNGSGCNGVDDVEITFSEMSIPAVITEASCGASDGEIVVAPQGGTAPYTYSWTSGGNGAVESDLGAGSVTVTVTDATGCSLDSTFIVSQPITFNYQVTSSDESCFDACNGEAEITPDGPGSYTYSWTPNVANSGSVNTLCQGDYEILVADQDGCTQVVNITIGGPSEVVTQVSADETEICIGGQAVLSANVSGGTPPYDNYTWVADPADSSLDPNAVSPVVNPAQTTEYTLVVVDANGCSSAPKTVTIEVLPPLTLDYTRPLFSPDTGICPGDMAVIDLVAGGGDGNYSYYLLPDDVNPVTLPIEVEPESTTTYEFMVEDGCTTPPVTVSNTVTVFDLPQITISADPMSGCEPLTVSFSDITQPAPASWTWDFGDPDSDNNSASGADVTHIYQNEGIYDVSLAVVTEDGCSHDTTLSEFIEVFPLPDASFNLNPEVANLLDARINFTDASTGDIDSWNWSFGDGNSATAQNPSHLYADTGTFTILLEVTTVNGCTDEAVGEVLIEPDVMFYVPNAFTPNGNSRNDGFRGYGEGIDWSTYRMHIFNRWGEEIYYTENIDEPWDGTYKGMDVEVGVYAWRINFLDVKGEDHQYFGHVTLLR